MMDEYNGVDVSLRREIIQGVNAFLKRFELQLQGKEMVYSEDGGIRIISKPGYGVMNEKGAKRVVSTIRYYLNEFSIFARHKAGDIKEKAYDCAVAVLNDLIFNWREYEISNEAMIHDIVLNVFNLVESLLSSTEEGTFARMLLEPTVRQVSIYGSLDKKKQNEIRRENMEVE